MGERRISVLLYLPWAVLFAALPALLFWSFEETPVELIYTAPHFASKDVSSRAEAADYAVTQIAGGSIVYRYVEYCVRKPVNGTIQRAWVGSAIVWPAPDVSTAVAGEIGCHQRSFAIEVPTSSPSRTFSFVQTMYVSVNQIRTDLVEYPPIPLRILSPQDVAKGMQ